MKLRRNIFFSRILVLSTVCNLLSTSVWAGSSQSHNVLSLLDTYNITDPNLTMTISSKTNDSGAYELIFTSSRNTESFSKSDVYLENGVLSGFKANDAKEYAGILHPTNSDKAVHVIVPASKFKDSSGNRSSLGFLAVMATDTPEDYTAPVITLTGEATITLEVGDSFIDPGATASDTVDGDLTVDITVTGSVDTAVVGEYTLTYNVSDDAGNAATQVTRTVTVSDTTAPMITLTGDSSITLEVGDSFTDPRATATDAVDGDLTANITVTGSVNTAVVGEYTLTYNVSDEAGNEGTVTRTVNVVDTTAPVITLTGDSSITLEVGDSFTDPRATATDAVDGDLTVDITVTGSVNTAVVGEYTLTYNVSDEAGNAATPVTRTVTVSDTTAPVITLTGDSSITLEVGDSFTDPRATATDAVDGDLTANITVTGSVNTAVVGEYTLTYNVSDDAGNAATEIIRTIIVEPVPITLIIPEDITVTATGYLTVVDLDPNDVASAVDGDGNSLAISTDQTGPFRSGTHEIVWSVSDGSRTVSEIQIVKVIPLVTIAAAPVVEEGASITVDFLLSGDAADYPVTIPFSISGTAVQGEDYSIDVGDIVTFDKGTVGRFTLNLNVDEDLEGQETIEISLGEPTNAVAGLPQRQVITIVEENVAPQLSFVVSQSNASGEVVIGTTVAADGGDVTVIPVVDDPNLNDTHVVDWSDALSSLPSALVDSETQSLSFSAATMLGVYSLTTTVTDSGNPPYDVSDTVSVNVIASAPVLADDEDTDGDGISDGEEGTGDSDGDNVPDYVDAVSESHIIGLNNDDGRLLMSTPGIQLSLGAFSLAQGDHDASVSENYLISQGFTADLGFDYPFDLVDFVATGAESGYSYPIAYSLGENVIPEDATYRKYMGDNLGWQAFVEDSANEVRSTYAEQGACPAASADNYSAGFIAGHNCVFLLIEDGGPNDADGEANGTLVDPSGIAVKYVGTPSLNSLVILNDDNLMADGTDTTTITVIVYDDQLVPLQHMNITGLSDFPGSVIGDFVEQDRGRYTAKLTVGGVAGSGPIKVVIDNGEVAITLISEKLLLYAVPVAKVSSGGGCTVATESNGDASLLLCLIMALLLRVRRRYQLT